jgi:hypothetical protein
MEWPFVQRFEHVVSTAVRTVGARPTRTTCVLVVVALAAGSMDEQAALRAQTVTIESVLARATPYVATFVERFSNVVTEEQYSQSVRRPAAGLQFTDRRQLRSDVVIIRDESAFGWTMFRDVFEVDGKPVRDREERLTRLFAQPGVDGSVQAKRIADESARYNIGPGTRTTNTPELSILFLQQALQPRFIFTLGGRERGMGEQVWVVHYRERVRPTLVRGEKDADLPASGRFWIDAETGRVLQTEIALRPTAGRWTQTTVFKFDDRLGIAVPVEMKEYFLLWATEVNGTARYGRFRTFSVSTEIRVGQ